MHPDQRPEPPVRRVQGVGVVRCISSSPTSRSRPTSTLGGICDVAPGCRDTRRTGPTSRAPATTGARSPPWCRRAAAPEPAQRWPPVVGTCSNTSAAMTRSKPRNRTADRGRRPPPRSRTPRWPPIAVVAGQAAHHPGDVFHLPGVGIERGDSRPPAHGLEGVASSAGAKVEQPVPGAHPESVVADGQQGAVVRSTRAARRRSTVQR